MMNDRKRGISTESKVFPYAKDDDLLLDRLIPIVKQLAISRNVKHPWAKMTAKEIIQSTGLYKNDITVGKSGYTLAAILLFGREEVIRSCLPGYVTDCILRRENLDRYDDRLRVSCNLIEAFDQIMDFIAKHTLDRFFIEGVQSVSIRNKISRELVSNTLVHREYTSTVPARVIIGRDLIVVDNWCLPKHPGKLDPETFTPQPKNPLIANFFVNIGYADVLGSGVRNLYKYTKIYSGGEPELIEGDVFKTIIPLSGLKMSDNVSDKCEVSDNVFDNRIMSDNMSYDAPGEFEMSDNVPYNAPGEFEMSDNVPYNAPGEFEMSNKLSKKKYREALLTHLSDNGETSAAEAGDIIGLSAKTARRVLLQLVEDGLVVATGANRNRKYKIV